MAPVGRRSVSLGDRVKNFVVSAIDISESLKSEAESTRHFVTIADEGDPSVFLRLAKKLQRTLEKCCEERGKPLIDNISQFLDEEARKAAEEKAMQAAEKKKSNVKASTSDDSDDDFVPSRPPEEDSAKKVILDRYLEQQAEIVATSPDRTVVTVREPSPLPAVPRKSSANSSVDSIPVSEATSKRLNLEDSADPTTTLELSCELQGSLESSAGGFLRPIIPEDEEDPEPDVVACKEQQVIETADGRTVKRRRRIVSPSSSDEDEDTDGEAREKGEDEEGSVPKELVKKNGKVVQAPVGEMDVKKPSKRRKLNFSSTEALASTDEDSSAEHEVEDDDEDSVARKQQALPVPEEEMDVDDENGSGIASEVSANAGSKGSSDKVSSKVSEIAQEQEDEEARLRRLVAKVVAEDSEASEPEAPKEVKKKVVIRRKTIVESDDDDDEDLDEHLGAKNDPEVNSQAETQPFVLPSTHEDDGNLGSADSDSSLVEASPKQTRRSKRTGSQRTRKESSEEDDEEDAALRDKLLAGLDELSASDVEPRSIASPSSDEEEPTPTDSQTSSVKLVVRLQRCKIPASVCQASKVVLHQLPQEVLEEAGKKGTIPICKFPELMGKRRRQPRKQWSSDEEEDEIRRLLRPVKLNSRKGRVSMEDDEEEEEEGEESAKESDEEEEVKPKRGPRRKKPAETRKAVAPSTSSSDHDADGGESSNESDSAVGERRWPPSPAASVSSDDPDKEEVLQMLDEMSDEEEEKDEGVGSDASKPKEEAEERQEDKKTEVEKRKRRRVATSEDSDANTEDSNKENVKEEDMSSSSECPATKKPRSDAARQVDAVLAKVRFEDLSSSDESMSMASTSEKNQRKRRAEELKKLKEKREKMGSPGKKLRRVIVPKDSSEEEKVPSGDESEAEVQSTKEESEEEVVAVSSDDSDFMTPEDLKKEKAKKKRRRRRVYSSGESEDDSENFFDNAEEEDEDAPVTPSKSGRKNIKKIIKEKDLNKNTQEVMKEEKERVKRLEAKAKVLEEIQIGSSTDEAEEEEAKDDEETSADGQQKDKMAKKFILDVDPDTKKPTIVVHKKLNEILKPHQRKGIKFMFDTTVESLKQVKEGNRGGGAILAHCMGLGKTLQVITLVHTVISHVELGFKNFLILCPKNTVLNWADEFKKWLDYKDIGDDVNVYRLRDKPSQAGDRVRHVKHWYRTKGVFIMSYSEFGPMADPEHKTWRRFSSTLQECLVDPGPDFVICDEGHLLKNENTKCFKSLEPVKTRRRLMLTGTPLQNNLNEYHSMVQLVKPNLLGTKKEFMNRFGNPIANGSQLDSSPNDVAVMRKRSYILHKKLEPIVQRQSYAVLLPYLPKKLEYVINVKLSPLQANLYRGFLNQIAVEGGIGGEGTNKRQRLLEHFHVFTRVWNHPALLTMHRDTKPKKPLNSDDDFIDDGSSDEGPNGAKKGKKTKNKKNHEDDDSEDEDLNVDTTWWEGCLRKDDDIKKIENSSKFVLFLDILMHCQDRGDKLVLFSSSRLTLNFLELVLEEISEMRRAKMRKGAKAPLEKTNFITAEKPARWENYVVEMGAWRSRTDYRRIDGSTSKEERSSIIQAFNNPRSPSRLLLVTTKAGGIGVNMVGANRAVLMDVNWNPANDVQALYRVFRLGQKKEVFVYRLVAGGCMEDKIYSRCVSKLSLSSRVVDEHQIKRHYSSNDLHELYNFDPSPSLSESDSYPALPKDTVLASVLSHRKDLITGYHDHDSLLENRVEESLDEEEKKKAWEEYDDDHKRASRPVMFPNLPGGGLLPVPAIPSYWMPRTTQEATRLIYDYCTSPGSLDTARSMLVVQAFSAAQSMVPSGNQEERMNTAAAIIVEFVNKSLGGAPQPAPSAGILSTGVPMPQVQTYAQPRVPTGSSLLGMPMMPGPSDAGPRFPVAPAVRAGPRWRPPNSRVPLRPPPVALRVRAPAEPVTIRGRPPSRPVQPAQREVIDIDE